MARFFRLIISNGMVSLVSMLLTFAVSRSGGIGALGDFAVGYAMLSLTQILVREMCLNPALRDAGSIPSALNALVRTMVVVSPVTLGMLIWGFCSNSALVFSLALAIPAFCTYDYLRFWTASSQSTTRTFCCDLLVGLTVAGGFLGVEASIIEASGLIIFWAISLVIGALVLYIRSPLFKKRPRGGSFTKSTLVFGIQGLLGDGSVHLAFFLLGVLFSPTIVGALRGATTFSGPVNLVTSTVQGGAISPIAVTSIGSNSRHKSLLRWAALCMAVNLPLIGAIGLVAMLWGEVLLGATWSAVAPVVPWILLDTAINSLSPAPYAAHRADDKANRVLFIALSSGGLRISLLVASVTFGGAVMAAVALVIVTAVSVSALWISYGLYEKRAAG